MKTLIIIICILTALLFLGWLGFQVKPKSFEPYPENTPELKTVPLPAGLPAPVERFYKTVYGDNVPVIDTVVIKGRANDQPIWGENACAFHLRPQRRQGLSSLHRSDMVWHPHDESQ